MVANKTKYGYNFVCISNHCSYRLGGELRMAGTSISTIAYYLALIGGILMILLGLLSFFESFGGFYYHWGFGFATGGIIMLIMGIIAIIGAKSASTLVWAIVLTIVGIIGNGPGGLLVVLGGIIGLIVALSKKA
jgi:hypothetical protein